MEDNYSKLYKAMVNSGYDTADLGGSEDDFRREMQDPTTRKNFYDWVSNNEMNGFRIGSYDAYEERLTAPPAPKAEDISPTSDKSGYTFTAEALGKPNEMIEAMNRNAVDAGRLPVEGDIYKGESGYTRTDIPLKTQEYSTLGEAREAANADNRKEALDAYRSAYNRLEQPKEVDEETLITWGNDMSKAPAEQMAVFREVMGRDAQNRVELDAAMRGIEETTAELEGLVGSSAGELARYLNMPEARREALGEDEKQRYEALLGTAKELDEKRAVEEMKTTIGAQLEDQKRKTDEYFKKHIEGMDRKTEGLYSMRGGGIAAMPQFISSMAGSTVGDKQWRTMNAIESLNSQSRGLIESSKDAKENTGLSGNAQNYIKEAVYGLADIENWLPVLTGMNFATVKGVIDKADEGKELTKDEEQLLEAIALNVATKQMYADDRTWVQDAGSMTGQMVPFMLEMAAGGMTAAGKGAMKGLAKWALKKFGKGASKSAKKAIYRTGAVTGLIGGAVGGGYASALTVGAPRTTAEVIRRTTGEGLYNVNEDGEVEYAGHKEGEGVGEAIIKGTTKQMLEYGSEIAGAGYASLPFRWLQKTGKGTRLLGWMDNFANSDRGKLVQQFMERTGWHGPIEEFMEEIHVGLLDPDTPLDEFFTKKNLMSIALGVAVPGAVVSSFQTVGGIADGSFKVGAQEKWKMQRGALRAGEAWKERADEWHVLRNRLNNGNLDELDNVLTAVYEDPTLTDEQKLRALEYGVYSLQYRTAIGVREAMDEGRMSNIDAMLRGNYSNGYEAADEQKGAVKQAYDMERERVLNTFGEEVVQRLDDDPIGALMEMNEVDRQEAIAYVNARTAYEGMIDRISDDIDERVKASDKEIDSHKNRQDGAIHPAMMRGVNGAAPKRVYIVNGNVATFEDGTIDKANSSSMIIVRDAETGEVSAASADDLESLEAVIDTEAEKKSVAEQIANEYAGQQAAIIEGESGTVEGENGVAPVESTVPTAEEVADAQAFADAYAANTLEAYQNYLDNHPEGAYREGARNGIWTLEGTGVADVASITNARDVLERAAANEAQPQVAPGEEAQPTMELTPAQKREEVLKRIPTKGKERLWTEAEPADVAEYIRLLTADPAKQQAAADKFIADIKAKQSKVDAISALEMDEQIAYWESVKALLQGGQPTAETAPIVEETQAPVVESAPVEDNTPQSQSDSSPTLVEQPTPQATNEMQPVSEGVTEEHPSVAAANSGRDTVGGSPVALAYLLEGGQGSILNAGYFLHGVAAAFPAVSNEIETLRGAMSEDVLGMSPTDFVAQRADEIAQIGVLITNAYGEAGAAIYNELLNNASGFVPRVGAEVGARIEALQPLGSPTLSQTSDQVGDQVAEGGNASGQSGETKGRRKPKTKGKREQSTSTEQSETVKFSREYMVESVARGLANDKAFVGALMENKTEVLPELVGRYLGANYDITSPDFFGFYKDSYDKAADRVSFANDVAARVMEIVNPKPAAGPKRVNVESLMGALKQNSEAKLSDHVEQTTNPSGNKLVTDERYNELKERMKKKLKGQMNIGVDPEILAIGTEMAVYHIEKGARKFADFAKGMIADLGDAIRPYLKAFYNGARELPEIEEAGFTKDMTPYEEVKTFDVANFDKQAVDAMATAETVTREAEVAKDVEAVKAPKKRESAEGKKLRKATQEDLEGNPVVYYKGEKHRILMLVHRGEQTSGARFTKPEITRVYLENMQDVKVDDLYVEDTRENVGESGDNSVPSQQTPVNNLNENNDGREENTAADNSGAQLGREELPDTEQVGAGVPVQDTARNSKRKRRNAGVGSSELGNGPQYDVNRNYTNEEIEAIVSSVTDIVDGKVVITGEVTDDIKAIVRGYESGGIAKKGRGILDEYYTDGKIVDAVNLLIAPYFNSSTPIRVLEPSVGIGNFIQAVNNIPTSQVVAFEINETTARIAKILYPDVDVNLRSFETEFIDESGNKKPMPQKYSLVIGNPPYGSHRGLYKGLGEESKIARYEDYFVKRSLDVLDEGGVLAMVLPSSWMDRHTKFGGYTIERAYRLPSGAFEATQVGTDIVILKKDSSVPVTEHAPYFEQFPERVLGEVKQRKGRYGRLEEYVEGDIDAAIEAIKKENAEQVADLLDIEKNNDALNDIESAVDETGSPEKAVAIVKDAQESEKAASKREQSTSSLDAMPSESGLRNAKADKKPAKKPSGKQGKQGKYKVELNRGVETVPTSAQFTHEFSEGEVEAFADTDYEGALSNPAKHRRYANYIGGQAIHDFYYAEGDIYSKLAQLEQEKDYIVENYGAEQYEKQKALLESVLPKQKSLEEITISPNTTFVKNLNILTEGGRVSLKDMFVDFLRKLPRQAFGNSSPWEVVGYINNEQVHGTDKQRNQLIRERRKRVANDLFNKFLGEELSDNAKKQVVAAFNREYNSTYRPDYSKVPMFSTINRDFKGKPLRLTSVQLAGIGRMTVKGVGVLAHEVGFGKTLSGILAMHEAMTRGFAKKPLIVVPNDNILKQWVETIGEVLPNATINVLGNLGTGYDLTDFKVNDGEFTIITYEGLKAMSFSDGTYDHLAARFSYITEDLNKHQSERDIQKEIEKKKELKGKMKRGTKPTYIFEDFGFDWLTVDEVHNANHIVSKVRLDKSVASDFRSQSQRTSDLGLKTWLAAQYIQEENNGRNVLLLSATPFTNKPLEYYSILSLVGNDMLERKGFFNVDQFFATFMEADNELEIGANGRPTQKTNVRRFRNNGLFQQLLSEFIDIKGEEDNPELVRPERLNKEYKIAQNELTAEAMAAAQELLSDNDTVLQGIGHARAAAFSPYATSLLGRQPKNHKEFVKNSPKIDATIRMIEQNIKDRPDAGQIIYSEVGVEYFPLIRDYLVKESGLKPSEVRIITGATSNNERVNIQTAFNNGDVKVVIGSPAIKEGLNLQGNTTDMYILSLPWNFTQLRQIEGRGWRQGNRWENIRINYMLTNDSVDVFMLQRLQLKQGLYNEAMKSGAESLDVSDIDTAELKTALITDPAVRAEIVTVQERAKLQQEKTQIEADLSFVMRKYEAYNKLVEKLDSQKNTIKMYREWAKKGDEYWAQRAEREEAQLPSLENEIEEEKQNLLKKGVNVDDIVRQTEQAQNAIAAIQEKIDNLKEFQEELTQKFREESEAKAKEQGDLVSTYIKERKAENKGGFYKIRPVKTETKAAEEETEDGVLYRSSEDNEARAITYDEAVQIVNDFTKTFKGAAKRVVISKGKDALEQQMREAGFVEESIEAAMEVYAGDDIPTAGHLWKSDGIVAFRFDSAEKLYEALWHENIHRALRKIYGNNRTLAQTRFDELPDHKKQEYIDFFKANGYKKSEYAEEALCYFVGSLPRRYGYLKNGRYDITTFFIAGNNAFKRFVNFAQNLIDYIVYHGEETEYRGLYDRTDGVVESGNEGGNGVHQRNSEIERDRTATTGGLTEEEIAMLEAATGYTREEIIEIFGDDLNRQGNGPLTDREVVMESDPYSKVLGKPRYYGKRQREFVARQRRRMAEKARQVAEKLNLDNVEVLESTEGLTGKKATSKGWFDPRTGKITVVVPNHGSIDDIVETVLHEAVAHYGLRKLFGENFNNFLDNVYNNVTPEIRAEITELAKKHGWDFHTATEEYLASLAENTNFERVNPSVWSNIKSFFMKMLAKVGITLDEPLGDNELRYILWRSHQNLVNPGWFNVFGQAEDIAKQYELGVGNYASEKVETENGDVAAEDDLRFRAGDNNETAQKRYDRRVNGEANAWKEGWLDATRSVRVAQEAIEKELGVTIDDMSNVFDYMNTIPSINKNKMEVFEGKHQNPFLQLLSRVIGLTTQNGVVLDEKALERYANAKHGLERGREIAVKRALTTRENGKTVFNSAAYEDWREKRRAILANGKSWKEQQAELDALAQSYGAVLTDAAGLTAIFDPEKKMNYAQIVDEAMKFIEDVEGALQGNNALTPFWEDIKGINEYVLHEYFVGGLISKKQYDDLQDMYEYYVPLRGFSETTADERYDYVSEHKSVLNSAVKNAYGRQSEAATIFATMLNMANSAIVYSSKNKVKQRLLNLAMRYQTPLLSVDNAWYIQQGNDWVPKYPDIREGMSEAEIQAAYQNYEAKMKELEAAGKAMKYKEGLKINYKLAEQWQKNQHAVSVMRNGREYIVYVNGSPKLAQAINGLLLEESHGWLLNASDKINHMRAKLVTGWSPSFVARNLFRDTQGSSVYYFAKYGFGAMREFQKNIRRVLPKIHGLYNMYKKGTLDENSKMHRYFKEFLENGGETGYTEMISIKDYEKKIKKMLKENSVLSMAEGLPGEVADLVEFVNRGVENTCRFAAYVTSREAGVSVLQSIKDSKEVSVNFNRKGSGAKGNSEARKLYMFLNPAIQAAVQRIELWKKYPARTTAAFAMEFALGAAMPMLFSMIYGLLGGDDDEAEGNYYNLTNFMRRSNICLPLGDGVVTIPLSHESRVFYSLGEMLTSHINGHTEYDNIGLDLVNTFAQVLPLNPVEGWAPGESVEAILANFVPDPVKPLVEIYVNSNFAGAKIHNATDFTEHLPSQYRGLRNTGIFYQKASSVISSEYEKNWADKAFSSFITPSSLEHLAQSYLGGLYTFVDETVKTAQWIGGSEEYADFRNVPILNSFYKSLEKYESEPGERTRRDWEKAFQHYYDEVEADADSEKTMNTRAKAKDAGAEVALTEAMERGDLLRIDIFNDGYDAIKDLYTEMDAAKMAKNFDLVDEIDKKIYAQKKFIVERMEQLADDPLSGYDMLTMKEDTPYGRLETYADVRDAKVISDFKSDLKDIYDGYDTAENRAAYEKQYGAEMDLYEELYKITRDIGKYKSYEDFNEEDMLFIRRERAAAIGLIDEYLKSAAKVNL